MKEVQVKIGASEPYICGGTPRDRYLGHLENISDLDITTGDKTVDYLSQEYAAALKKQYQVDRKAMPDGHSTIFIGNLKLDFSSNFNVPGIEGMLKKLGIENPTDMQKEMFSRDFTCNALLLSIDLKNVIDPTNKGFSDIKERKIKTCLSPEITLTTNRNRVIRAIYLASKLDFEIDESIVKYVQQHPESVKISTEKVMTEKLNDAFKYDADKAASYLSKMGLWNYIPITEAVYPYYIKHVKGSINGPK
jgi:tRNA nucleotidyltransferase/poly(A) polymerase